VPPDSTPFDPRRILEVLARHQVQCVMIGGYAAVLAGIDVVTRDLDITNRPDGTGGYEDLNRSAQPHPLGGDLHIAIASLEDIIRSKTAAGRAKDLATLPPAAGRARAQAWQGPQTGQHQRVITRQLRFSHSFR
jgi:hypothetical protein